MINILTKFSKKYITCKIFYSFLFFVLLFLKISDAFAFQKNQSKPNIVFILVDDLGIKDLCYTGSTFYETPAIDKLAKQSFVFTQGYATSAVCSPSRASILTGKFTARHGITDWIGAKTDTLWRSHNRHDKMLPPTYEDNLKLDEITLAETLKANGYTTFFAGKWHLGGENSAPEKHGFDINVGGWDAGGPVGGYFSPFKNPKLENKKDGENLTIRLANETAAFINTHKNEPFLAYLSFYAVHGPIQTTQEKWSKYQQKVQKKGIEKTGFTMGSKLPVKQVQDNAIYAGLVETLDDAVAIVLESLKNAGLDKNTIVVFTSDNGGVSSGDSFSTSNLPYRGGKGHSYEGGIREPYFIYIPWLASKKREIKTPVTGADFYPTILDFANIPLLHEQHKDGISLKPILEKNKKSKTRSLFWHYPHYGNQGGDPSSIIRKGNWKLIYFYEDARVELYNLEKDPYERFNVASKNKEIATALQAELISWLTSVNAKYPVIDEKFDAKKRAEYEKFVKNAKLKNLEEERIKQLQSDFSPNKNWWGSKTTKD